jgi:broad specificity phosphatase PhoE
VATTAPAEILLVRHALPEPDGTKDPGLGEVGLAQARRLAAWLEGERIDAIYSSHLKRAIQTVEPVAAARGLAVAIDEGLREWISAAPSYQQVEQLDDPERAAAWNEGRFEDFLPEHDADDLRVNMIRTMRRIGLDHQGERVVAASHGGASNTFLAAVVGSPKRFFFNPGYTSISRIQVHADGRFVLLSINETAHVR